MYNYIPIETCSAIPAIENGYVIYTDEELPPGTTASYACNNGYLPSSFVNRTCTNAKFWSDITEPTCYGNFSNIDVL